VELTDCLSNCNLIEIFSVQLTVSDQQIQVLNEIGPTIFIKRHVC